MFGPYPGPRLARRRNRPAAEKAMPATARFFSAQSIALSCFWSRGSGVVDSERAVLDHATVDGKSVPLEEEHT
jgi:hypothetical protein